MNLEKSRMLIREFFNKDPDIVSEESPPIIFYSKYHVCIAQNGKDIHNTRHISKIVHFARNVEKCKMHRINWCEGAL